MQQIAFPEIVQPLQAAIAQAEADMENLNQSRDDKKAEIKRLRKSLKDLTGSAGSANKQVAGRRNKQQAAA